MAKAEDGTLIDPFGGQSDLEARVLRHVSEAFAEDPVRILRLARFAARFGFDVAPDTMTLMRRMVECGEADYLVPERVWQEFARGLAEPHPELMFDVLERSGLLGKLFPELKSRPRRYGGSLAVRYAHLTGRSTKPRSKRCRSGCAHRTRFASSRSPPRATSAYSKGRTQRPCFSS